MRRGDCSALTSAAAEVVRALDRCATGPPLPAGHPVRARRLGLAQVLVLRASGTGTFDETVKFVVGAPSATVRTGALWTCAAFLLTEPDGTRRVRMAEFVCRYVCVSVCVCVCGGGIIARRARRAPPRPSAQLPAPRPPLAPPPPTSAPHAVCSRPNQSACVGALVC
jgi:hypothetical protein